MEYPCKNMKKEIRITEIIAINHRLTNTNKNLAIDGFILNKRGKGHLQM